MRNDGQKLPPFSFFSPSQSPVLKYRKRAKFGERKREVCVCVQHVDAAVGPVLNVQYSGPLITFKERELTHTHEELVSGLPSFTICE